MKRPRHCTGINTQMLEMILTLNVLSFPDDNLLLNRFSSKSVIYLHNLICPLIISIAQMFLYFGLIN